LTTAQAQSTQDYIILSAFLSLYVGYTIKEVNRVRVVADLHTHTISSGHAYSTITENAMAASKIGLTILGMTDHGPSMPGAPHLYHFGNLSVIPKHLYNVKILCGVEANIISYEGDLDIPVRYLKRMDLVIVGLHTICYPGGTLEQNTKTYLAAMHNPYTDIMAHPGRKDFELDLEKIAYYSAKLGVAVEINNSSLSQNIQKNWENCRLFAKYAAKYQSLIALGSDAHYWDKVGDLTLALSLVKEAEIKEDSVLNTSEQKIISYLRNRRKQRRNK